MTEIGPELDGKPAVFQRLLAGIPKMRGPAPVHLWNPDYCGEIDMRIAADGSWHYNGSLIGRIAMVKLFASILRKDTERYVLVTPVERVGIRVEDAPFLAVELDREASPAADHLFIRTNLDDVVEIGEDHPMRFAVLPDGGVKPYIRIRGDLWALASRALTHELMALGSIEAAAAPASPAAPPRDYFGIRSGPAFFPIAPADSLGAEA